MASRLGFRVSPLVLAGAFCFLAGWAVIASWDGDLAQGMDLSTYLSRGECAPRDEVRFTAAPADPDDLSHIFPYGLMTGSHVTPTDHQYYWATIDTPVEPYPVRSPGDGVVIEVDYQGGDRRVIVEHSCDVYTIWILLQQLAGPLAHLDGAMSDRPHAFDRISVKAGEIIVYDGGTPGFDFSVHDGRVVLSGYVCSESYASEPWKVYTADPSNTSTSRSGLGFWRRTYASRTPWRQDRPRRRRTSDRQLVRRGDERLRGRRAAGWPLAGSSGRRARSGRSADDHRLDARLRGPS